MSDLGIISARGVSVQTPLPVGWLGRPDAPLSVPVTYQNPVLTYSQVQCLVAQIGFDKSQWNYSLIDGNSLGRYQFSADVLESYGFLIGTAVLNYGQAAVFKRACWVPTNYSYGVSSMQGFLAGTAAQDHLIYQILFDTYAGLVKNGGIRAADSTDVCSGMMYAGLNLGIVNAQIWRTSGIGNGIAPFNSGRYAITVLGAA